MKSAVRTIAFDDRTDDCASGADDVALRGLKFKKLRFLMIADTLYGLRVFRPDVHSAREALGQDRPLGTLAATPVPATKAAIPQESAPSIVRRPRVDGSCGGRCIFPGVESSLYSVRMPRDWKHLDFSRLISTG
jgi:hypothetical protein